MQMSQTINQLALKVIQLSILKNRILNKILAQLSHIIKIKNKLILKTI